jgi:hypothetical protein
MQAVVQRRDAANKASTSSGWRAGSSREAGIQVDS